MQCILCASQGEAGGKIELVEASLGVRREGKKEVGVKGRCWHFQLCPWHVQEACCH